MTSKREWLAKVLDEVEQRTGASISNEDVEGVLERLDEKKATLEDMSPYFVRGRMRPVLQQILGDRLVDSFEAERYHYPGLADRLVNAAKRIRLILGNALPKDDGLEACQEFLDSFQNAYKAAFQEEWAKRFQRKQQAHRWCQNYEGSRLLRRRVEEIGQRQSRYDRQSLQGGREDSNLIGLAEDLLSGVSASRPAALVDYGCGEAPLLLALCGSPRAINVAYVDYVGVDVDPGVHDRVRTATELVQSHEFRGISSIQITLDSDLDRFRQIARGHCICVLRNVLHELRPGDLVDAWDNLTCAAFPDGAIHIYDPRSLPNEEPFYWFWDRQDIELLGNSLGLRVENYVDLVAPAGFPYFRAVLRPQVSRPVTRQGIQAAVSDLLEQKKSRLARGILEIEERTLNGVDTTADQVQYLNLRQSLLNITLALAGWGQE